MYCKCSCKFYYEFVRWSDCCEWKSLCDMFIKWWQENKSNLGVASWRLSLRLDVELYGSQTGSISLWFHIKFQENVEIPTRGEISSEKAHITSHTNSLCFQLNNNNQKFVLLNYSPLTIPHYVWNLLLGIETKLAEEGSRTILGGSKGMVYFPTWNIENKLQKSKLI